MLSNKKTRTIAITMVVLLNIVLICGVIYSVISAFSIAQETSFAQNIENVRTLTNASANKIELEYQHHTQEMEQLAAYINNYNGVGMTKDELDAYLAACYGAVDEYTWQLVENTPDDEAPALQGFPASIPCTGESGFTYRINAYQELAKLFLAASEETLGQINCTSEFTDASSALAKSSAVTTTVRIRQDGGYVYKTLMLILRSEYINALLSSNNEIDTLTLFNYSCIIVDKSGNYVISNSRFQGTNFLDYMALYDEKFTKETAQAIREELPQDEYSNVLFYDNSRGEACAYTIVPVHESEWYILSLVPISSFHDAYNFSENFLKFALLFMALFALDIALVLVINRRLRVVTKRANEANESKSLFLSSMSHDIRTPMNAIVGMTIIADKQLQEETVDREALRECMKSIELSGNHLLTLINDILDISKIESGKIVLHPSDFSIAETMNQTIEICREKIKEKDFVFEAHIHHVAHEYVSADSLRVNQIFINILTNAIKYTPPGGKIVVELTENVSQDEAGVSHYVYRVEDTGIGMTPEFVNSIFDRFTRAVDTRINTVQGTGLGMAIVKQLVDMMGGTIDVQSELNVGSVFTVTLNLPTVEETVERDKYERLPILLIDDDATVLESLKITLEDAGAVVDTAETGEGGIQMAEERGSGASAYRVIFVDWRLGGQSGGEVVSRLRRTLGREVCIAVMTAYNLSEIEQQARACGADLFLTKPLFRSKLYAALDRHLFAGQEEQTPREERFADMRVLVAEDNETNWKVINRILAFYGISAQRAENGRIAVEMIEADALSPELVLMDVQMPVMNGYEATRAIRALADAQKASVPIYAMTADTFDDDVRKCREAGMNGHLSKPINMQKLLEVIKQHYHSNEAVQEEKDG